MLYVTNYDNNVAAALEYVVLSIMPQQHCIFILNHSCSFSEVWNRNLTYWNQKNRPFQNQIDSTQSLKIVKFLTELTVIVLQNLLTRNAKLNRSISI